LKITLQRFSFYCFSGLPTAILQSWPGCPCGGFKRTPAELPPPVLSVEGTMMEVLFESTACCAVRKEAESAGFLLATGVSREAPTAISHRCHGWPWAGFNFGLGVRGVVLVAAGLAFAAGAEFNGAPTARSHR
jgi:hypothetical protein